MGGFFSPVTLRNVQFNTCVIRNYVLSFPHRQYNGKSEAAWWGIRMDKQEPKIIGLGSSNEELIEETVSEILQKHPHQVAAFLEGGEITKINLLSSDWKLQFG